ncbi:MAG TPA: sensor histidine kinase [Nitrososphaera sp.]|nr:sensor histidine kinase [Nitrososphaera sp.]
MALVAISAVSIFLVYTSLQSTETRLQLAANQELRNQLSEEAGDATIAIGSNLNAIRERLEAAAASPLLQDDDQMRALLDATRVGIQYDGRINYIDRDGIVVYTTDQNLIGSVGSDRSDLVYYNEVKEKNEPVLTGLFKSSDNRSSVSVAVPALGDGGDFNGVLAAILHVDSLVSSVSDRLPLIGGDQLFIVSADGTITGHREESFVSESIFDRFDALQNDIVSRNLQLMTEGRSGVFEYATQDGQRKIAAYSSLAFSGNIHAWSVLIATPSSQGDVFSSVLSDQRIFTIVAIILIGIIAAIFMALILTLNRRLHRTVQTQDVQIKGQLDDLQDAYERLTEQDKIKDEFINIAAHELRTPVLPIILSAEGLAEDLGTSDNSKVEIILRNAKRINKLTNDILDVSRIKSNTFRLQKDRTSVKRLVEEAIQDVLFKMMEDKNPNLKVAFESKLPEGKDEIMADRGRLNQVLANLLDNAVNFTDQGRITVTVQESKDFGFVEVTVADTGKGIDPAIRSRLFEKFVTKSEKARGTGLGLYLCKAIVEAHGGKIWVEDRKDDKGTVFAFTLPAGG